MKQVRTTNVVLSLTLSVWASYRLTDVVQPSTSEIGPQMSDSVRRSVWHDPGFTGTAQRVRPSLKLEAPNWLIL